MIDAQQIAQKVQYAGAGIATGSGGVAPVLAENYQAIAALGVIVGIVVGIAGLLINWYYLHKKSKEPPA